MRRLTLLFVAFLAVLFAGTANAAPGGRLKMGRPVSGAPFMPSQSLVFGRITRVGDGATAPTYTGSAPTSFSCTGTGSGDWSTTAQAVFTPAVTPLQASYTLSCTAANAQGSATPTITITTEANTYSVAAMSQFVAVSTQSETLTSGKTIKFRPGTYLWPAGNGSGSPFRNKLLTSLTTVTTHGAAGSTVIEAGVASGGVTYFLGTTNLRYYRLKFHCPFVYGVNTRAQAQGACMVLGANANNFILQENEFYSDWLSLVNTYGFTTLYAPSADCPAGATLGSICYTYRGLVGTTGVSNTLSGGLHLLDNSFHGAWRLLQIVGGTTQGPVNVVGNHFYDYSGDCLIVGGAPPLPVRVAWNVCDKPLSLTTDLNHRDAFQFIPGTSPTGALVFGNITYSGRDDSWNSYPNIARDAQIHFMEDIYPNNYMTVKVFLNFGVSEVGHGVSLYNPSSSTLSGNLIVLNPSWASDTGSYPTVTVRKQGTPTVTPCCDLVADNFAYGAGYEAAGGVPTWGTSANNITLVNPQTSYGTYFDGGPGGSFTANDTYQEALVAWNAKAAGALLTAVPKIGPLGTGYVDYTARTWDYPRLNSVNAFTFTDVAGQALNTVVTSNAVLVTAYSATPPVFNGSTVTSGGTAASANGALVTVTGTAGTPQFRIASDAACAVAVTDWTTTPAIAASGRYVCVRGTSAAVGATERTVVTTIGAGTDTFTMTTAP